MSSKKTKSHADQSFPRKKKSKSKTPTPKTKPIDNTALYAVSRNSSMKELNRLIEASEKNLQRLQNSEEKIHLFYDQLSSINQNTSSVIGAEFFKNLVQSLADIFGVHYAMVGVVDDASAKMIKTLAFWDGNKIIDPFLYCAKNTPCENVLSTETCFYPQEVQKYFPDDKHLADLDIHSYLGVPLVGSSKQVFGVLSIMDDKPLVHHEHYHSILNIFAARCTSELERMATEAKLAQKTQELENSNRAMEDFVSIASHDLQEPLRKIMTFGNRLTQKDDNLQPTSREYIKKMQKTALRMQSLLKDLLLFSKASTQTESFKKINLKTTLKEVLTDLELLLEKNAGEILIDSLPTITGNAFQIRQLFYNLLSNAIKYHEANRPPKIEVSSSLNAQGEWKVSIKDQGIGFDEKYKERIFLPFERLHGREEYEGTGIGLAICQKIVENHGGEISVSSQLEQGSCFSVTFPAKVSSRLHKKNNR